MSKRHKAKQKLTGHGTVKKLLQQAAEAEAAAESARRTAVFAKANYKECKKAYKAAKKLAKLARKEAKKEIKALKEKQAAKPKRKSRARVTASPSAVAGETPSSEASAVILGDGSENS